MDELIDLTSLKTIKIKIYSKRSKYDNLLLSEDIIRKVPTKNLSSKLRNINIEDKGSGDYKKVIPILYLDAILAHYFIQELKLSPSYRKRLINTYNNLPENGANTILIQLRPAKKQIIDYAWNFRTTNLAWERVELDHTLSWMSTLGGAFSALGDYFPDCALTAGKISFHQMKLALRLGDPTVASRCKLYFSLSLIQRGHLKKARDIIYNEYMYAKNCIVVDVRLIRMCLGIWAKLKYEFNKTKLRK